ncbi:MAG TPA: DNA-processing protein DprA, partial [Thermoleophilia bacterium]|nr:DNA-processing protein DprA [Thermoleophilia bacterium]
EHSCREIWQADRATLLRWSGGRAWVDRFIRGRSSVSSEATLAACRAARLRFIAHGAADYPESLRRLHQPPAGLYVAGDGIALEALAARPRVTIVGTRRPTSYGMTVAARLAAAFAARGVCVLSGLALGIDGRAHRATLDAGGITAAVVGCGADVVYPGRHRELREKIVRRGVVLSEYAPGCSATPWSFPERNRVLAALGAAVVVVEAPERSGALITARRAAELGKDVFAVPAPILTRESVGCNRLIYDGAIPCLDPDEVVEDFLRATRMERGGREPLVASADALDGRGDADGAERLVLLALAARSLTIDEVVQAVGLTMREASVALAMLEVAGKVVRRGPGKYAVV